MASVYTNKYVSDIPLKRPPETFVDDPGSLEEVSLDDLVFDLANDIKDINTLHGFHALAVVKGLLEDLILLGENREASVKFRRKQLQQYSLDVDALSAEISVSTEENGEIYGEKCTSNPENGVFRKMGSTEPVDSASSPSFNVAEQSAKTLPNQPLGTEEKTLIQTFSTDSVAEGPRNHCDRFISTESLVKTTSLEVLEDPITCHNIDRLKQEVLFHSSPKVKLQAEHLLRTFSLAKAPPLSIEQFLVRIKTYSPSISVSVYIHSAYMLYKICVLLDVVALTPLNVYRFILASLRCSTKKLEDVYQKQKSFATVGGVALRELCKIEVSFLYLFNFKMVVSERILNQFLTSEFVALHAFCQDLRNQKL